MKISLDQKPRDTTKEKSWVAGYIEKFKGRGAALPPPVGFSHVLWSWLGSFTGIFVVAAVTYKAGVPMMIGSFGASAVLIYAAIDSPLAQPRNLIGGHVVSAIVAVSVFQLMGRMDLTVALAVSLAIVAMLITRTLHPPGGATALIAVDSSQGYDFVFYPVLAGAIILLIVALIKNNMSKERAYPERWF